MIITLKNLHEATAQQVFDQVVTHLRTQKVQCAGADGSCLYRHDGLKCAAGALIADDEYVPEMDKEGGGYGSSWPSLVARQVVPSTGHTELIRDLQRVHDNYEGPKFWEEKLFSVARQYSLTYTVPQA